MELATASDYVQNRGMILPVLVVTFSLYILTCLLCTFMIPVLFFSFIMGFPSPAMKMLEQLHKITPLLLPSTPFQFTTHKSSYHVPVYILITYLCK